MGKDVIDIIKDDISEQADLVVNQIDYEIAQLHDEQINSFKDGLKKEQDTYLEKELNDLRILSITQSSRAKLETKHRLLKLREELIDSLFDETKLMLKDFVKSDDYNSYLNNKLDEVIFDDGYLICDKKDNELMNKLLKERNIDVVIKNEHFEIGGFKYISNKKNLEYDYSLDTSFKEQIEWFKNNSRFTI